ncbi:methyltransferase domain-containing protein [Streptacidiphilus fuscans]|uniref:Protein-L-isoaspartate O-methyltransferase n=1 Tax=Streptacidiphilus fuscans TaxID=2789292 RepID=A0A931FHI5_9ACTN|nr:methyltransferase domain-containing protein [Streptacidiphilus fuscans]MBF9071871.1 methyltransferase domain-containing protein [Streptacidiphilus fuscans]
MTWSDLTRALVESGALTEEWAPVFERVPRSPFLPDAVYPKWDGEPVSRSADPERWQELAESDRVLITQFDDGEADGDRTPTSSSSMPTVVAQMFSCLGEVRGLNVLDVGTGTGWTTALAAAAGASVTSVEVDPRVGERAAQALEKAGVRAMLTIGDATRPLGTGRVFDRVHATAAVRRIPQAWINQTRPGGVIVTPYGTDYCNGAVLRLEVADDGSASGRFSDGVSFMWVRSQRPEHLPARNLDGIRYRPSAFDPRDLAKNHAATFAVGLHLPGVRSRERWSDTIEWATGFSEVWDQDSFAHCRYADWDAPHAAAEQGPRDLWHEIQTAYAWWEAEGSPGLNRLGLTVTPDGEHRTWLDSPANVLTKH